MTDIVASFLLAFWLGGFVCSLLVHSSDPEEDSNWKTADSATRLAHVFALIAWPISWTYLAIDAHRRRQGGSDD